MNQMKGKFFRIHIGDLAWHTKRPKGLFVAIGNLVDAGIPDYDEIQKYWDNRQWFESNLPIPSYYQKGNPEKAITWYRNTHHGREMLERMGHYLSLAGKYQLPLKITETNKEPGPILYEDVYQIAVAPSRHFGQAFFTSEWNPPEHGSLPEQRCAEEEDFQALFDLRMRAMRPSLEAVGRYDLSRSKERFSANFQPKDIAVLCEKDELIGFYGWSLKKEEVILNHLYVDPDQQGKGLGSLMLGRIKTYAMRARRPLRLEALKASPANDFYLSKGFEKEDESEFDNVYLWQGWK